MKMNSSNFIMLDILVDSGSYCAKAFFIWEFHQLLPWAVLYRETCLNRWLFKVWFISNYLRLENSLSAISLKPYEPHLVRIPEQSNAHYFMGGHVELWVVKRYNEY